MFCFCFCISWHIFFPSLNHFAFEIVFNTQWRKLYAIDQSMNISNTKAWIHLKSECFHEVKSVAIKQLLKHIIFFASLNWNLQRRAQIEKKILVVQRQKWNLCCWIYRFSTHITYCLNQYQFCLQQVITKNIKTHLHFWKFDIALGHSKDSI